MGWRVTDRYERDAHERWRALPWRERYPAPIIWRLIFTTTFAIAFVWVIIRALPFG